MNEEVNTHGFLAFLNTSLDLWGVTLGVVVGCILHIIFADDAKRLLGVELALADMSLVPRGHVRVRQA